MTAADAMSRDFPRIAPDQKVRDAVTTLLSHGWPSGVVVDDHDRPVGVFGRQDVLRGLSARLRGYLREGELGFALLPVDAFRSESVRDLWRSFWDLKASELARPEVPTVEPNALLAIAAQRLQGDEEGVVAVVRGGRVIGALRPKEILARIVEAATA